VRWVGFVRNVMIGREGLTQARLLEVAAASGATLARSHRATGNLSFEAPVRDIGAVVDALESGIGDVLGRPELVAVRRLDSIRALVDSDPFRGWDPAEWALEVSFLRHDAPRVTAAQLGDSRRTMVVAVREREVMAARPIAGGARPHVNSLLQRASGLPATSRGWSTLVHIAGVGEARAHAG
jgi:uncharacterized protein (DUF1697 family)